MLSEIMSNRITTTLILFTIVMLHSVRAEGADSKQSPNVVLICVDDLRPELNCFGVDYIHSPNIDAIAAEGCVFTRHYVQAPTCGASRYAMLTGCYGGASNGAIFARAKEMANGKQVKPSMPAWFRQQGYTTVSVGKVSHHPGGRGGPDWNDESQPEMPDSWDRHLLPAGAWQHPRGWMHGLANGEIRVKAGEMDVMQSIEGEDEIYPDGISTNEALRQVELLAGDTEKPFFLAFGVLRPHLPFGAPAKYMNHYRDVELPKIEHTQKPSGRTTWHSSGEFMKYNRWKRNPNSDSEFAIDVRKHYAACVSYADAQIGRMVEKLKELKCWDNTIVVVWGDHGWHLGEHAIWGKHALFEESLRSPLVIRTPAAASPGVISTRVVESVDLFPTLCELAGLPSPDWCDGQSLASQLNDDQGKSEDGLAVSYFRRGNSLRTSTHRLIAHADGFNELYDHRSDPYEVNNIAEKNAQLVAELREMLTQKLGK